MKNIYWFALIFVALPALATEESREAFYEKHNSQNMSGWKGIVFICSFDLSDKVLEKICHRAETDAELLAASHNIALKVVDENNFGDAAYFAALNKFVTLEYKLRATKSGNYDVKAVHARLTLGTFFSNGIEKGSKPNSIDNIPRSGDLELWSRGTIGSGAPDAGIAHEFSNAAETNIKKALTLYLKYNK